MNSVTPISDSSSIRKISYSQTNKFSKLVLDYLSNDPRLMDLVDWSRDEKGYKAALESMDSKTWPRTDLVSALYSQYKNFKDEYKDAQAVKQGVDLLSENAYCTVTAHQLNFFTGPLYVIYKAVSTITLAQKLSLLFPDREFVPVFWLGTEDHDLEEIDHFNLFNKTLSWETKQQGAAGRLETAFEAFAELMGESENAEVLKALFSEVYNSDRTLGEAQHLLLHRLFGAHGLLVLNADTPELKKVIAPIISRELKENIAKSSVADASELLAKDWHVQAPSRDINLFLIDQTGRHRIDKTETGFRALNGIEYSLESLLQKLEDTPEVFSPNVLIRPLQQQIILPAIATIGGGGELAYWLQLRDLFKNTDVFFPVLMLRNSVLWVDKGSGKKIGSLNLDIETLFSEQEALVKDWVRAHEQDEINLDQAKSAMEKEFEAIAEKVNAIDKGLVGRVQSEKAQLLKSIDKLEVKLMKAAKDRHEVSLNQLRKTQDKLFPAKGLQERKENFAPIYLRQGTKFIDTLVKVLDPMEECFTIISE
ncbi:MAG: bacillithiol biosynthesis cysteine-adding enzyme BshC [Limisphaerales bacterium]|jgi:bacillithiol biosynthesis cysteine-adding enzyme BshC